MKRSSAYIIFIVVYQIPSFWMSGLQGFFKNLTYGNKG